MADPVPVGYRFLPTDQELLLHYLGNKVAGRPLPSSAVSDANVYGTEPWVLLGTRREAYFFATRKRKNATGSRVDRSAGTGSWTLYGKEEVVTSVVAGGEVVLGRKSSLSFNNGLRKNSGWTMHEYELVSASDEFQTQVLCHVCCTGKAQNEQLRRCLPKRKRGSSPSPASKKACMETAAMSTGHQEPIFSPSASSGISTETDHSLPTEIMSNQTCLETMVMEARHQEEIMSNEIYLETTVVEGGHQEEPIFSCPSSISISAERYHASEEEASLGTDYLDLFEADDLMLFDAQDLFSEETLSFLQ